MGERAQREGNVLVWKEVRPDPWSDLVEPPIHLGTVMSIDQTSSIEKVVVPIAPWVRCSIGLSADLAWAPLDEAFGDREIRTRPGEGRRELGILGGAQNDEIVEISVAMRRVVVGA